MIFSLPAASEAIINTIGHNAHRLPQCDPATQKLLCLAQLDTRPSVDNEPHYGYDLSPWGKLDVKARWIRGSIKE